MWLSNSTSQCLFSLIVIVFKYGEIQKSRKSLIIFNYCRNILNICDGHDHGVCHNDSDGPQLFLPRSGANRSPFLAKFS